MCPGPKQQTTVTRQWSGRVGPEHLMIGLSNSGTCTKGWVGGLRNFLSGHALLSLPGTAETMSLILVWVISRSTGSFGSIETCSARPEKPERQTCSCGHRTHAGLGRAHAGTEP